MTKTIKLEIEFTVGTLDEIGIGGLKQPWIDATRGGREYSITSGAGVGNPLMEAHAEAPGGRTVYAKADMREFAPLVFAMLDAELAD